MTHPAAALYLLGHLLHGMPLPQEKAPPRKDGTKCITCSKQIPPGKPRKCQECRKTS